MSDGQMHKVRFDKIEVKHLDVDENNQPKPGNPLSVRMSVSVDGEQVYLVRIGKKAASLIRDTAKRLEVFGLEAFPLRVTQLEPVLDDDEELPF